MKGFTLHTGLVAPLDIANVDTDAIIPKQFLQKVTRIGFGQHLFHDWRFLDDAGQQANPEFVPNFPQYQGASILLTRENFGCGSSREHAPWALADYGFRVIIAPNFADIFYGNALNNQLLPIALPEEQIDELFQFVMTGSAVQFTVDLIKQIVLIGDKKDPSSHTPSETHPLKSYTFSIDSFRRHCLLNGLDNIGLALEHEAAITAYEQRNLSFMR